MLYLIQRKLQETRTGKHGLRSSYHALWMYPSETDMQAVVCVVSGEIVSWKTMNYE